MTSRRPGNPVIRWLWVWGPAVAQMAAIFYASSIPDLTTLPGGVSDKVGHFGGYALLGAFLLRALAGADVSGVTRATVITAIAVSVAYGATDEGHQHFVHGRVAALDDWYADAAGAIAAIALSALATRAVAARRARSGAV